MKKFIVPALAIMVCAFVAGKIYSSYNDARTVMGSGALWSTEIEALDRSGNWDLYGNATIGGTLSVTGATAITGALTSGGNFTVTDDDIIFGNGTVPSTATTSGNSYGTILYAYLGGTNDAVEGSVLHSTTPVAGQGVSVCVWPTATQDQTSILGIASAATSTGSVVGVYVNGYVLARTTGTVNPGDTLVNSDLAVGYLEADTTPTTGADVGIALAAGTASGGLTRILLYR